MHLFLLVAALLNAQHTLAGSGQPHQLVVYHIATANERQQHFALLNLENHLDELYQLGQSAEIKVLIEGEGVRLLSKAIRQPLLQQRILGLQRKGVAFVVGRESLKRRGLDAQRDTLFHAIDRVVDNGLLELVRLQQRGYAYIPYLPK